MKKVLFPIAIFCSLISNAQNYLINFAGSGASSAVTSVKVENLMKGTNLNLNGNDILRLTLVTDINDPAGNKSSEITIYPNPMSESSLVAVTPPVSGDAVISVFDVGGKQQILINRFLSNTKQEFSVSGLGKGFFIFSVSGQTYHLSAKLLCNSQSGGLITIKQITSNIEVSKINNSAIEKYETKGTIDMPYSTGDILRFTAVSGDFITIYTDTPVSDKTITFNFTTCTDGDGNKYAVVIYKGQTWMAENLKTTKYNDNTPIPNVSVNSVWASLTTPAYCWYNNDEASYKNVYGALYNWYVVSSASNGGKNVCPAGWHVPETFKWVGLYDNLGGSSVAGGKLKETGTTHWSATNAGVTNEIGFKALPGGACYFDGSMGSVRTTGYWWTSDPDFSTTAWAFNISANGNSISKVATKDANGFSIRCIKDN